MKQPLNLKTLIQNLLIRCLMIVSCSAFTGMPTAFGQTIKLTTGQKFSYEDFSDDGAHGQLRKSRDVTYRKIAFEVTAADHGNYKLKVSPAAVIRNHDGRVINSTLPYNKQEKRFIDIAEKVLTTCSYSITINKQGDILNVSDTAGIKAAILAKLGELHTPVGWESHAVAADELLTKEYYQYLAAYFKTPGQGQGRKALVFVKGDIDKQVSQRDALTGLPAIVAADLVLNKTIAGTKNSQRSWRISKVQLLGPKTKSLIGEAEHALDLGNYYGPVASAKRAAMDLYQEFRKSKGKYGLVAETDSRIDSIERTLTDKQAPDYLAAKADLQRLMGRDAKDILAKVPYHYLYNDGLAMAKLKFELNDNNFENLPQAMELLFTTLKHGNKYPINIENLSWDMHDVLGKQALAAQSAEPINKVLAIIARCEQLGLPEVTAFFAPLKTYCQVKLANDPATLGKLAGIEHRSLFDNFGRYRSLIYTEFAKKHLPDSVLAMYNDRTIELVRDQIDIWNLAVIPDLDNAVSQLIQKSRTIVCQKYLADAYFNKSVLQKDRALAFIRMAADYMPSQTQMAHHRSYLQREYNFLPYRSYTEEYLKMGDSGSVGNDGMLKEYVDLVIIEPERYALLKERYLKAHPEGNFKKFFNDALKEKLPAIPNFALNERAGAKVAYTDLKDRYTFVDLWGTWCGACIAEIPGVEALYKNNPAPDRLSITTIACLDNKKNVDDFMTARKFTYPVLMSDGVIEKDLNVHSYPTKLLLLPNGLYVNLSYYSNYKQILQQYMAWEI